MDFEIEWFYSRQFSSCVAIGTKYCVENLKKYKINDNDDLLDIF